MNPFQMSLESRTLVDQYPPPESVAAAVPKLTEREVAGFVRLWLSEGIPKVFSHYPLLWESLRAWLGDRLKFSPKGVTLVGSCRMGYSLSPGDKFGDPMRTKSDLDLAIVSDKHFDALVQDGRRWFADYDAGDVQPSSSREARFWPENRLRLPKNIDRGFLDVWKLPARSRYPAVFQVSGASWRLERKLHQADPTSTQREVKIRAYRDWAAFERQVSLNLRTAVPRQR